MRRSYPTPESIAIGSALADARRAHNKSQERLATELGISLFTISRIENGRFSISRSMSRKLHLIAAALNVSIPLPEYRPKSAKNPELAALGAVVRQAREEWSEQMEHAGGRATLEVLCKLADISTNVYQAYERGRRDAGVETIARLSAILPIRITIESGRITGEIDWGPLENNPPTVIQTAILAPPPPATRNGSHNSDIPFNLRIVPRGHQPVRRPRTCEMEARGKVIKAARELWKQRTGKSIQALLAELDIPVNTYYGYEGGRVNPRLTAAAKLSRVLLLKWTIAAGEIGVEVMK